MNNSIVQMAGDFITKIKEMELKRALLIYLPLLLLCAVNIKPDCDCYFIIENGEYLINTQSFPHEDWVTIHDGLHFVMQQWVFSAVVYLIYNSFGFTGLYFFVVALCFALYLLIFKICLLKSNGEHFMSFLATFIASLTISYISGTIRPTILSLIFVSLTILIMEKSRDNANLVFILPLISIIQSNTHSTFWLAIIGTIAAYYIFDLRNKKLLTALILSFAVGFINPYGYEAVFQPFYAIGYEEYSSVSELMPLSGMTLIMFMSIPLLLIAYLSFKKGVKKEQYPILLLFIVTTIASLLAMRSISFFVLMFAFYLSSFYKQEDCEPLDNKNKKSPLLIILSIMLILLTASSGSICLENIDITKKDSIINIGEMCNQYFDEIDESELEGKTVMTDELQTGQIFHHNYNMTPYIDGRLETYIDSLNKKENIFGEFLRVKKGLIYLDDFLEKYGDFDYIVTTHDSCVGSSARHLDDYEVVFDSKHDNGYVVFKHIE